jgi:putative FmdB family regulatory protein
MPLYEYVCKTCGKEFEMIASMGSATPARGPDCTSTKCACERRMSLVATPRRSGTTVVMEKSQATQDFDVPAPAHQCSTSCGHQIPTRA